MDMDGEVEVGARHEPCRTVDTEGHSSPAAEARFWERKLICFPRTMISVERTGSAMEEAMLQKSTAADAAGKKGRNNKAVIKKRE